MSKYTKGPWEMEAEETMESGHYIPPQVFSVDDPDNPQIVCTLAVRNGVTEIENGKIIACAPSLYEFVLDQAAKGNTDAHKMLDSLPDFD